MRTIRNGGDVCDGCLTPGRSSGTTASASGGSLAVQRFTYKL